MHIIITIAAALLIPFVIFCIWKDEKVQEQWRKEELGRRLAKTEKLKGHHDVFEHTNEF